ncbi:MAG: DUF1616 domain-containing protein [Halobacteriaceae archaeon]
MRERLETYLTWVLALVLVVSVAAVIGIALNPPDTTEPYTEFYILGPQGNASMYPRNMTVGEFSPIIIGISNHEDRTVTYTVAISWNGTITKQKTVTIPAGDTLQMWIHLHAPMQTGEYRVRSLLYKGTTVDEEPYRWLRLYITVLERPTPISK